jgi:hypothetical protein
MICGKKKKNRIVLLKNMNNREKKNCYLIKIYISIYILFKHKVESKAEKRKKKRQKKIFLGE